MPELLYLDHNSTTPLDATVLEAMLEVYRAQHANPASQHRAGQRARAQLESLRRAIVEMLGGTGSGMETDTLVFTSGGTESNNLAVLGLAEMARRQAPQRPPRVLLSAIEHPSVAELEPILRQRQLEVGWIPVNAAGACQLDVLEDLLAEPPLLVSLMLANNETGVLQPVAQAAQLCRERDVLIHTDAVQAVGKMPVHFGQLGVDALTFNAHKQGGPRGIGGLLLRSGVTPLPQLFGGHQQGGLRPGTEDLALVAGLHQAISLFDRDPAARRAHLSRLRDHLEQRLREAFPELVIHGSQVERAPHTSNLSLPGVDRQSLLMSADLEGLCLSAGSACASGSSEPSPVLVAMGLPSEEVQSAVRISVGIQQTIAEMEQAAERLTALLSRLRKGTSKTLLEAPHPAPKSASRPGK